MYRNPKTTASTATRTASRVVQPRRGCGESTVAVAINVAFPSAQAGTIRGQRHGHDAMSRLGARLGERVAQDVEDGRARTVELCAEVPPDDLDDARLTGALDLAVDRVHVAAFAERV